MLFRFLGENLSYGPILDIQEKIRDNVLDEKSDGEILFLSHKPVYTLGLRGKTDHLIASEEFIKREKIEIHKIKRGGDITYHGPGQLVIYPIVPIRKLGFSSIKEFVVYWGNLLSNFLNETYSLTSVWSEEKTGVWVGNQKIVAVGMHFKKFVPIHGFAVNINPDFNHFNGIIPCGIKDAGVTSLFKETEANPSMKEVSEQLIKLLEKIDFKNFKARG